MGENSEATQMELHVFDRYPDFAALRRNWDEVYAADADANIFLSWPWLSRWLQELRTGWFVLAARSGPSGRYVAFLPLRVSTESAKNGGFYTVLTMAGNKFADYTGAIAKPAFADQAFELFAQAITEMNWAIIRLSYVRDDAGLLDRLIRKIPLDCCELSLDQRPTNAAGIDNTVCPYVELPDDWEDYLSGLSANTRQKIRRLLRRADSDPTLRITETTDETIDRDIEILIGMWMAQWAHLKGGSKDAIDRNIRRMLKHYLELGVLHMPIFWLEDRPMAVLASLIDWEKRRMHFFIGGRDDQFNRYQPGLSLHAYNIRKAIGLHLKEYDLLRGNEPYKFTFGAAARQLRNVLVKVKPEIKSRRVLDRRSIPQALHLIKGQLAIGDIGKAEIGFRQILQIERNCAPALAGLARIKLAQGRPAESETLLKAMLKDHSGSSEAWFMLGQCHAMQKQWNTAKVAYRRALAIDPQNRDAQSRLAAIG